MAIVNAVQKSKSVADPTASYESIRPLWEKSRAIISGERFAKDYDGYLDTIGFSNLLIPFSPSMTPQQYDFYKAEAELPGIVSQYARIIIGGLLRKQPQLKLPASVPPECYEWIMNHFSHNSSPLVAFLDEVLWEEVQTSRAWVYVDYPQVTNPQDLTKEDFADLKPYPILWNAESIINWRMSTDKSTGVQKLEQIIIRNYEEVYKEGAFHPEYLDTVWVHELFEGFYRIQKYQKATQDAMVTVANGKIQQSYMTSASGSDPKLSAFILIETNENILINGERCCCIPAWPVNGSVRVTEPMLSPFIDKEVALYNKISRRNHLLYGASTYTPVLTGNISDDQFEAIVNAGLGTWIKLPEGGTATVLDTPTAALVDMDRSIASTIEDMAKLGIRMLTAETAQSGVALDIRNAAQTSQLGTLNVKISNQFASIIAFMINWRYDLQLKNTDVEFELSADFNPTPLGADWLRLATEWYETGKIPRSVWLQILKVNDMISPDYDDVEGQVEITQDNVVAINQQVGAQSYTARVAAMAGLTPQVDANGQPIPQGAA
jgi:hypothetical protein